MEASSAQHVLEPQSALELGLIDINQLRLVWDQVQPLLERACEYSAGEYTPASVVQGMGPEGGLKMLALANGETITSIMVVAIALYPAGRKLNCVLTSGENVDEWMPFEPKMDAWAREYGCVAVRIPRARKGWVRKLSHWQRMSGDCCVLEREI